MSGLKSSCVTSYTDGRPGFLFNRLHSMTKRYSRLPGLRAGFFVLELRPAHVGYWNSPSRSHCRLSAACAARESGEKKTEIKRPPTRPALLLNSRFFPPVLSPPSPETLFF